MYTSLAIYPQLFDGQFYFEGILFLYPNWIFMDVIICEFVYIYLAECGPLDFLAPDMYVYSWTYSNVAGFCTSLSVALLIS